MFSVDPASLLRVRSSSNVSPPDPSSAKVPECETSADEADSEKKDVNANANQQPINLRRGLFD
jgi:hypothetical protein